MYWKRWLTALIIIPPLIALILKGSQILFTFFSIAVSSACLWEYYRIVFRGHEPRVPLFYPFMGYLSGALVIFLAHQQNFLGMLIVFTLNLIAVAVASIFRFRVNQDAPLVAVKQNFGTLYIPLAISFLIMLRATTNGPLWVLFLFWVVAWGDTGALYIGSIWGRHKLCPAVSPKKTIEGALGGLTANLVSAWLFKIVIFNAMNPLTCTLFALIVGGVGQIGDLFESEFKRAASVKDSSTLIPGHGGFLDRLDAMLLTAPVAYSLKEFCLP